jgi:hypothetical protein
VAEAAPQAALEPQPLRDARAVEGARAEQRLAGLGALDEEVQVLLPGVADAAADPLLLPQGELGAGEALAVVEASRLSTEPRVVVRSERRQVRVAGLGRREARSRSSFTSRSWSVRCARSTRPLAWGVFAQGMSMLNSDSARPNCVAPRFFFASDAVTRKMLAWLL